MPQTNLEDPNVKEFLEDQIHTIAKTKNYEILALEVMPDHLHLFIATPPFDSPTSIVKVFKGVTALRLFKKFPELKKGVVEGKAVVSKLLRWNCWTCFSRDDTKVY